MKNILAKTGQPNNVLNHILDQPELPAIIQSLDTGVLTRLIRHIGLESSAEIISLTTIEQLKCIFDEDLWNSDAPGQDEVFDADRFGLWLDMLLETGASFAARKVMELDEDLMTLGLCRLILVVNLDALAFLLSNRHRSIRDDLLDKVLESTLNAEFDAYLVIAKSDIHWDAIQALFSELNELDHTMLNRLLERCYQISWEYIEDNGGLFDVLSSEEMLESDLAADREARREVEGFVLPSNARYFLNSARMTGLREIVDGKTPDPVTRGYFDSMNGKADVFFQPIEKSEQDGETAPNIVGFLQTLQSQEVLQSPYQKRLGCLEESRDHSFPLVKALRNLDTTGPSIYCKRRMELAYLSNILISGCEFKRRRFRPVEAFEAALSLCSLGSEYLLDGRPGKGSNQSADNISALLVNYDLVKLFRVGWKILNKRVVFHTARALLKACDHHADRLQSQGPAHEMGKMVDMLRTCILSGKPWMFLDQIDQLHSFLDGDIIDGLGALLQEYPTMPAAVCNQGLHRLPHFISSRAHIQSIQQYLERALEI